MIELRVLGTLDVRRRDGPVLDGVLAQPKRCALLAYLVVASPRGFQHRESLLPLFWPELDTLRARRALRQSIHYLRQLLGDAAIISRGADMLAAGEVWCDVAAFEAAADAGDDAAAVSLYRGELLPGLFVPGSVRFEEWLESERTRVKGVAAEVFWRRAEQLRLAADLDGAAVRVRQAAALQPDDEAVLRRALAFLQSIGDRPAALQLYESFTHRLEEEYQLTPAAQTIALVADIRRQRGALLPSEEPIALPPPLPESAADGRRGEWPDTGPSVPGARRHARSRLLLAVGTLVGVVLAGWAFWEDARNAGAPFRPQEGVLAVLPFRTAGSDPGYAALGEQVVDLLGTRFSGTPGPRAVDARATLAAWRATGQDAEALSQDSAVSLARRLGADLALHGSAYVVGGKITVHATLVDVGSRRVRATATAEGPADSLASVLDAAAARLLGQHAGEHRTRLDLLTTHSLPALRAYLAARAAVRAGAYETAVREYDHALQLDTAFALAAIELIDAMGWTSRPPGLTERATRAIELGYAQLSDRDRAHVHVYYGDRVPVLRAPTGPEMLRHRERFVQLAPDRPEAWYVLADLLFHNGALLGLPDARRRAESGFARALELDPELAGAAEHLLHLAAVTGDTAGVRRYRDEYIRQHAGAGDADFVRWFAAHALGDTAALAQLRARWSGLSELALVRIIQSAQEDGVGLSDARLAGDVLQQRRDQGTLSVDALSTLYSFALNTGRRHEARELFEQLRARDVPPGMRTSGVSEALYWDADPGPATAALPGYERVLARGPQARVSPGERLTAACVTGQWRLAHGDTLGAETLIGELQRLGATGEASPARAQLCAALHRALLESVRGRPPALRRAALTLDSLVAERRPAESYAPLVAARLLRQAGDPAAARTAAQRRGYGGPTPYLAPLVLEEARAAAELGDASALALYERYLALRVAPDPALVVQRDSARQELEQLRLRTAAEEPRPRPQAARSRNP